MSPVIRIHAQDNVVIARQQLLGGTVLASEGVTVSGLVPPGHKVATRDIAQGEPVRRYDQIIGVAKVDVVVRGAYEPKEPIFIAAFDMV